jgi:hypothetical protein
LKRRVHAVPGLPIRFNKPRPAGHPRTLEPRPRGGSAMAMRSKPGIWGIQYRRAALGAPGVPERCIRAGPRPLPGWDGRARSRSREFCIYEPSAADADYPPGGMQPMQRNSKTPQRTGASPCRDRWSVVEGAQCHSQGQTCPSCDRISQP